MSMPKIAGTRPSFLNSDRVLAKAVRPIVQFSRIEAAGGIVLVASAAVALVWANSPWSAGYEALWSTPVRFEIGTYAFREDLGHVVDDLREIVAAMIERRRQVLAEEAIGEESARNDRQRRPHGAQRGEQDDAKQDDTDGEVGDRRVA